VKAKLPGIKLLLLGKIHNPTFRERIDQRITELDIKPNIEYKEFVPHPEVRRYLAESRIGLVTLLPIPKFHKNIPIKQFEYMAFGLPVVCSNLPPIENFIRPVEAGIIVDPENPVEIANALKCSDRSYTI
jgi:glycosyltransferase involved in cell wall biosynthesis